MDKMISQKLFPIELGLSKLVAQGAGREALFRYARVLVQEYGREGGFLAFHAFNNALDRELPEPTEEVMMDVLDALTGQCNTSCLIGSGDYHLSYQAA